MCRTGSDNVKLTDYLDQHVNCLPWDQRFQMVECKSLQHLPTTRGLRKVSPASMLMKKVSEASREFLSKDKEEDNDLSCLKGFNFTLS